LNRFVLDQTFISIDREWRNSIRRWFLTLLATALAALTAEQLAHTIIPGSGLEDYKTIGTLV